MSRPSKLSTALKYIFRYLLVIGVCGLIYWFSSNDGSRSSVQSGRVVALIQRILSIDTSVMEYHYRLAFNDLMSIAVRKAAHFSVFMLLGGLSYYALFPVKSRGLRLIFAVMFCTLYACTDELHQTMVSDRAGLMSDVFIDAAGALLGAFIFLVLGVFFSALKVLRHEEEADPQGE